MREFQIGKSGLAYSGSTVDLSALRAQFDRQHYLKFTQVLEPTLLDFLQLKVDDGEFYERVHDRIASNRELCLTGNAAFGALLCLINDARLFQIIQDVTGCDLIRCPGTVASWSRVRTSSVPSAMAGPIPRTRSARRQASPTSNW